jgi:hypothetical protein
METGVDNVSIHISDEKNRTRTVFATMAESTTRFEKSQIENGGINSRESSWMKGDLFSECL